MASLAVATQSALAFLLSIYAILWSALTSIATTVYSTLHFASKAYKPAKKLLVSIEGTFRAIRSTSLNNLGMSEIQKIVADNWTPDSVLECLVSALDHTVDTHLLCGPVVGNKCLLRDCSAGDVVGRHPCVGGGACGRRYAIVTVIVKAEICLRSQETLTCRLRAAGCSDGHCGLSNLWCAGSAGRGWLRHW